MRNRSIDTVVFASLIAAGAAMRLSLQDLPNFAPVAAIALFAGYFFRSRALAVAVPVAIMAITDAVIGTYDWRLMSVVYAMLALPVLARGVMRRSFQFDAANRLTSSFAFAGLVGSSLFFSVVFFLVTNFMCWVRGHGYTPDAAGLVHCYAQALPFFKNTLLGDLFFACTLFGGYALLVQRLPQGLMRPAQAKLA